MPGAIKILIIQFGHNFTPMISIEDYTGFFLSIILGLGISFELPILIFFLALFGIVSPQFLWKNIRYAILAVFVIAAAICPSPDPSTMCIYAIPMLALYMIGIGVAWWVHPTRRKAKERRPRGQGALEKRANFGKKYGYPIHADMPLRHGWVHPGQPAFPGEQQHENAGCPILAPFLRQEWESTRAHPACDFHHPPRPSLPSQAQQHFDGDKAIEYTRQFVAIGPRWPTGPGHVKAEAFLRDQFQRNHDQFEEDAFTADTPIGTVPLRNFIVRFPGKKPGVIVLATHYETNYPLRTINFVGANDGGSTTGLLLAIGDQAARAGRAIPGQKTPGLLRLAGLL